MRFGGLFQCFFCSQPSLLPNGLQPLAHPVLHLGRRHHPGHGSPVQPTATAHRKPPNTRQPPASPCPTKRHGATQRCPGGVCPHQGRRSLRPPDPTFPLPLFTLDAVATAPVHHRRSLPSSVMAFFICPRRMGRCYSLLEHWFVCFHMKSYKLKTEWIGMLKTVFQCFWLLLLIQSA